MSAHSVNPSTVQPVGGVPSESLVTSGMLTGPRDHLMDAVAANHQQARLLYDPSPEVDSLLEHLTEMARKRGDLDAIYHHIEKALPLVRATHASNAAEGNFEREALGPIDAVARMLHMAGQHKKLGVVAAARRLREPLKVVRRMETERVPARDLLHANRQILDVIGQLTVAELRGPTMREKLGTRQDGTGLYDVLCGLLTDGAESEAA